MISLAPLTYFRMHAQILLHLRLKVLQKQLVLLPQIDVGLVQAIEQGALHSRLQTVICLWRQIRLEFLEAVHQLIPQPQVLVVQLIHFVLCAR